MVLLKKFLRRAIVAVIGLALLLGIGYYGNWPFFLGIVLLAIVALSEYYSALQAKDMRPGVGLGWICAVLLLLVTERAELIEAASGASNVVTGPAAMNALQYILIILFACVTLSLIAQFGNRPGQSAVVNSAVTVFGVVYIGLLMSFVLRMRYLDVPTMVGNAEAGEFAKRMGGLLLVMVPVWASDTFAYLGGNLLGKHKLAPRISPNKTVEGGAAGLIAAVLGALAMGAWLGLGTGHSLVLGLTMGILGPLGDLGKSVLKRDLGIKDFGSAFGPHGGVLDRFDAILFCMPLVYWYLWAVFLKLPSTGA